ncbi:DNA polymerase Y family protein [Rosettibacter firmus]|uniref:DNA polymerase Y family protein n=1 Tax=Rosettibacter firmus TaxID=3111522 RepID=UPI00336BE8EE
MPLRNLFIDFNSFFASCEQQQFPHLRGKPVAVVPVKADTTCCIAASYEAKKYGIKTGTLVADAKKVCPELHIVQARHRVYIEYHHKLIQAIETCIPVDAVYSIDEMSCTLIGKQQERENAIALAKKIKETIYKQVGECLKCSIGIAPNQYLAKTATDMQKPDGLVVIEEKDLPHILYSLKLSDLVGIGRRMEPRLRKFGIDTVEKLCNASKSMLRKVWGGIEGERMYMQLRGEIVKRPPTHRTTIGHSHVMPPDLRSKEGAYSVLHRLLQKAAMRLRYMGFVCGTMSIKVKFLSGKKWRNEISFNHTQNTIALIKAFEEMWKDYPPIKEKPIAVAVTLYNLMLENYNTLSLFEDDNKFKSLNNAIDLLNKKFGYGAAYFAGSHFAVNSAPMRIAFTQIPNVEIEDDDIEEI